ncbi:hypothetical protein [Streptomyces phaeochromogenes]|uniref:hypothetical protein n=1 Tax=Streptomyces phaeochromogenes TaxID=1923 RepID=UPI002DD7D297|nr:hypothetical protein [Streptomyces phaeochromogenes]WRZ34602.1 hypothetical protein OG931_46155 [Streptomyces phaeochromogenes]
MYAGENTLHFHVMLMARGADVPEEWRGGSLLAHHADLVDADEADRVLVTVRETFAAL